MLYMVPVAWTCGIIFIIGIPLYTFSELRRNRLYLHDINHEKHKELKDELGTLYLQYEKSYWYWELIEMFKKIFFTGLLLIIGNGMAFTIVIAIIVQFIYILVVEKHAPYITDRDDLVQFMGSVQLFFTLLAGLVLKLQEKNEADNINEKDNQILGGILIAINASVLLMAVVSIFLATGKGQKCFDSLQWWCNFNYQ